MRGATAGRGWRRLVSVAYLVVTAGLLACASVSPPPIAEPVPGAHWEGRLALKIQTTPVQAVAASFELQGNAQLGSLVLSTPLGTTLARMQWGAKGVLLQTDKPTQYFDSLDALTEVYLGHSVPIASLFAWLAGDASHAAGWAVDTTGLSNGRLIARQLAPLTPVELKIVLER